MALLLTAARDQRAVRRCRRRRDHLYDLGQVSGRVMRHLLGLAPIEVRLLPCGMVSATHVGLLVATAGGTQRLASPEVAAHVAAVDVAIVAPSAQEEHLSTATATDEAKGVVGVHGSGRGRQELDANLEPCDEHLVELPAQGVRP